MKKLVIATIALLFVAGMGANSYGAPDQFQTTAVTASVNEVFSLALATPGVAGPGLNARSSTTIGFKPVDGSATWYYNNLAVLGAGPGGTDPSDGKSDVVLVLKANTANYYLKVNKGTDGLNTTIGYGVSGAFDGGAATPGTLTDGTVSFPTGFAGSTGTGANGWGELPTSPVLVYSSGTTNYATNGVVIPISYALVPAGLSAGSYATTITYTLTENP
jgi:hypothetical protein